MGFRKKPIAGAHASRVIGDLQVWSADIPTFAIELAARYARTSGSGP
jgi:hypothetical protein